MDQEQVSFNVYPEDIQTFDKGDQEVLEEFKMNEGEEKEYVDGNRRRKKSRTHGLSMSDILANNEGEIV